MTTEVAVGPALDALVATEVMGWHIGDGDCDDMWVTVRNRGKRHIVTEQGYLQSQPMCVGTYGCTSYEAGFQPSTGIAAAKQVFEKVRGFGYEWTVIEQSDDGIVTVRGVSEQPHCMDQECLEFSPGYAKGTGATEAEAICRFAMAAKRVSR